MILHHKPFDPYYYIQVANGDIITDNAFLRIEQTHSDPHSFANLVPEEQPVERPLKERRENREHC